MTLSIPRVLLAIALAALMAWGVVGLARVDTDWGPPSGGERLVRAIDAQPTPQPADAMRATAMLHDSPIDGRAWRVLAQLADAQGDKARADTLYAIAVRRAPRDRPTRAALIDRAFAADDLSTGFAQLDALLRVAPLAGPPTLRALMPSLADTRVRDDFVARLASNPPWRGMLLPALKDPATDPAVALGLLARLGREAPLTAAETDARIGLLQRTGQDAGARQLWLSTLPADARGEGGLVFDGGFEHPDVTGAYGWRLAPSPGVDIGSDDGAPAQGTRALAIRFGGRAIGAIGLEQSLALAPGSYRLAFAADNGTDAQRPIAWRVLCRDGAELLSQPLPPAGEHGWQRARADFIVPAGCPGQVLRLELLARSTLDRQLSGTLRLDDVRIDRQQAVASPWP
jgi:hypothetical protein